MRAIAQKKRRQNKTLAAQPKAPARPARGPVLVPEAPAAASEAHRVCVALPGSVLDDAKREALRLDRSVSWVFQKAWRTARESIKRLPPAMVPGSGGRN